MTTEEKVKAYDEALEKAKMYHQNAKEAGDYSAVARYENVFPELTESKDEKIRKELIEALKQLDREKCPVDTYPYQEWIAWLEKQKENAEGDFARGYDCGYECCLNSHGAEWFEKQKEQKPVEYLSKQKVYDIMNKLTELSVSDLIPVESDEYVKIQIITADVNSLLNYPIEQKPAEWSKEAETNGWAGVDLERYLSCLQRLGTGNPQQPETINSKWFKEHCRPQSKLEWSEEDEKASGDLMWCIEQARKSAKDENDMGNIWFAENWLKNRLKSLRPQPHWKPSKEQLEALLNILHPDDPYYLDLKDLYEDLKKLM